MFLLRNPPLECLSRLFGSREAKDDNENHKIESIFNAFAKRIKQAAKRDINNNALPSTKGFLQIIMTKAQTSNEYLNEDALLPPFGGLEVAIIKYNAGNVQSVQYALQRLGVESVVTDDEARIRSAAKVIFPGVGHAAPAMQYLKDKGLDKVIVSLTQPVLGICLGMQLMCSYSEEGNTNCLSIFKEDVKLFRPSSVQSLKVPHVGWNSIHNFKSVLFNDLKENDFVYSVHSYYAALGNDTVATTDYVHPFSAALQKNNFYAVQFHPEKSGIVGETILKNFITI